jgi:hypothetical protein
MSKAHYTTAGVAAELSGENGGSKPPSTGRSIHRLKVSVRIRPATPPCYAMD